MSNTTTTYISNAIETYFSNVTMTYINNTTTTYIDYATYISSTTTTSQGVKGTIKKNIASQQWSTVASQQRRNLVILSVGEGKE